MPATATATLSLPAPRTSTEQRAHDLLAVRTWARSVGYPIDETSGVPLSVLRAYRQVHGC